MRVFTKLQLDKDRKPIDPRLEEKDKGLDERLEKSPEHENNRELESELDWVFRLSLAVL
jgi:hypothetical protein